MLVPMKRVLVVDANVIIADVLRFARTGKPTALSEMIRMNGLVADVCVPPCVVEDVRDHLPEVAARKMSPEHASAVFDAHYSPFLFVETAEPSGSLIEQDLTERDVDDVPLLQLALSLNAVLLSKDRDLLDSGAAVNQWLEVVFAVQIAGSLEGGAELTIRLLLALPTWMQLAFAVAALLVWLSRGDRAARFKATTSTLMRELTAQYATSASLAQSSRIGSRLATMTLAS